MQWFKEHNEQGKRYRTPLNGDLTTSAGAMNAARFIEWVARGQPGHDYRKKKETVMTNLRLSSVMCRAFAVYAKQTHAVL